MSVPGDGPWVEEWLSPPRFAVYLAAASADREKALRLYEWNSATSASFLHDLGHLEVGLRNAYDAALRMRIPTGQPHWVFSTSTYFPVVLSRAKNGTQYDVNKMNRDQITRAISEATVRDPAAPPGTPLATPPVGKVIAELTFGFWRYLSSAAQASRLWIPHLHKGFQPGTSRKAVDQPVSRLHRLRNRVAHLEPLLGENLAARHADLLDVAGLIAPELRDYIAATSGCLPLLAARPS